MLDGASDLARRAAQILVGAVTIACVACSSADATEPAPPPPSPSTAPLATTAAPALAAAEVPVPAADASAPGPAAPGVTWPARLGPIVMRDDNSLASVTFRLYAEDGSVDARAVAEVNRVLWGANDGEATPIAPRLLQLVVKAAHHFGVTEVHVISSHRTKARPKSKHRSGEAIDFSLPGVRPKDLAAHLRTNARVGVGLYVHPASQFVHLDVRDASYHWIDGSPPRRTWRETPLPDPTAPTRDAAYTRAADLPEIAAREPSP